MTPSKLQDEVEIFTRTNMLGVALVTKRGEAYKSYATSNDHTEDRDTVHGSSTGSIGDWRASGGGSGNYTCGGDSGGRNTEGA